MFSLLTLKRTSAGWKALNEFIATNSLETKQMRSTKNYFNIFIEIMLAFLLYLLLEHFKPESYCFEGNNRI